MKTYTTQGTCSRAIEYEVTDGVLTACRFIGGCPGNTVGVARLAVGRKLEDIIALVIKEAIHEIPSGPLDYKGDPVDCEIRRSFKKRALTEQDIAMLRELLDRCTKPRSPALASLLCGAPRKLPDVTNVCIKDDHLIFKTGIGVTKILLSEFYEFLEWAYSYLEFFTFETFVKINLPCTRLGLQSLTGKRIPYLEQNREQNII